MLHLLKALFILVRDEVWKLEYTRNSKENLELSLYQFEVVVV